MLIAKTADDGTTFPPDIAALLSTNDLTSGAAPLLAIPGHQVPLAGGARASHLDLWMLARTPRGLLSIAIEEHSLSAAPRRTPAAGRLEALRALLEIDRDVDPHVPPGLIHRTAAALLEARRFFAVGALVIVRSAGAAQDSFGDFQRFVRMMGGRLQRPGHLLPVAPREGLALAFGWTLPTLPTTTIP
jgi:hypothetical protein